jgi:hypothetical protein
MLSESTPVKILWRSSEGRGGRGAPVALDIIELLNSREEGRETELKYETWGGISFYRHTWLLLNTTNCICKVRIQQLAEGVTTCVSDGMLLIGRSVAVLEIVLPFQMEPSQALDNFRVYASFDLTTVMENELVQIVQGLFRAHTTLCTAGGMVCRFL